MVDSRRDPKSSTVALLRLPQALASERAFWRGACLCGSLDEPEMSERYTVYNLDTADHLVVFRCRKAVRLFRFEEQGLLYFSEDSRKHEWVVERLGTFLGKEPVYHSIEWLADWIDLFRKLHDGDLPDPCELPPELLWLKLIQREA